MTSSDTRKEECFTSQKTALGNKCIFWFFVIFFFKPRARKPVGDSSSKDNALLHHPMQQSVWVYGFVGFGGFFSEPETKIVERSLFMLFLLEKQNAWREHAVLVQF